MCTCNRDLSVFADKFSILRPRNFFDLEVDKRLTLFSGGVQSVLDGTVCLPTAVNSVVLYKSFRRYRLQGT